MKAMIFAAGLGTRLRPITDNCPKALVKVGGVPMLQRIIEKLISIGVCELVVNVHYYADMIIDFIHRHNSFGIKIHISDERASLLDTGGGILAARRWLDGVDPFIVHNADILTDFPIEAMYEFHCSNGADATLLVSVRESSRYLLFDNQNRMCGWTDTRTGEVRPKVILVSDIHSMAFGGVHILSPNIFKYLSDYSADPKFSIIPFYADNSSLLNIVGFVTEQQYRWIDIGNPETLRVANNMFKNRSLDKKF